MTKKPLTTSLPFTNMAGQGVAVGTAIANFSSEIAAVDFSECTVCNDKLLKLSIILSRNILVYSSWFV